MCKYLLERNKVQEKPIRIDESSLSHSLCRSFTSYKIIHQSSEYQKKVHHQSLREMQQLCCHRDKLIDTRYLQVGFLHDTTLYVHCGLLLYSILVHSWLDYYQLYCVSNNCFVRVLSKKFPYNNSFQYLTTFRPSSSSTHSNAKKKGPFT